MRDEVEVRQRRTRRHDLRAGDDEPVVALLLDVHEHVADLVGRLVAIDRWVDDRVVPVQDALLRLAIPALGVLLVGLVEVRVGAERREERRLVVGAAAEPPIRQPRPLRDRPEVADAVLGALGITEELVRAPAAAGVGLGRQHIAVLVVVQRVVQARDRARRVAKRRMRRYVLDALAVDVHLPAVAQALQILRAGQRRGSAGCAVEHLITAPHWRVALRRWEP